jgi:hypothetical protein
MQEIPGVSVRVAKVLFRTDKDAKQPRNNDINTVEHRDIRSVLYVLPSAL